MLYVINVVVILADVSTLRPQEVLPDKVEDLCDSGVHTRGVLPSAAKAPGHHSDQT